MNYYHQEKVLNGGAYGYDSPFVISNFVPANFGKMNVACFGN